MRPKLDNSHLHEVSVLGVKCKVWMSCNVSPVDGKISVPRSQEDRLKVIIIELEDMIAELLADGFSKDIEIEVFR